MFTFHNVISRLIEHKALIDRYVLIKNIYIYVKCINIASDDYYFASVA